jgi:hypothetical protein
MSQILTQKPKRRFDFAAAVLGAAQLRDVSPLRIATETVLLRQLAGRLGSDEYFSQGAWQPGLRWSQRRAFLGSKAARALNAALNPPYEAEAVARVDDKIVSGLHLTAAGVPMPRRLAVTAMSDLKAGVPWLESAEAVLAFLRTPGVVPCFGKPAHSSLGLGAVRLEGFDASGALVMGGGRTVRLEALVAEIRAAHPRGYIFEEMVVPHPDLARLIGPVIGCLRVVTTDAGAGPEVLYASLRAPAPGATVDATAGPMGTLLAVDRETGRILRQQDRRRLGGIDDAANPVTGRNLVGEVVPLYQAALDAALAVHRALPERGLVGVDVMISDRGPVVGEVNSSPHHAMYESAFARGLLNPELLPRLQAVRARFRAVTPRPKGCPLK